MDISDSGTLTTTLALTLPAARGPVPSLGLNYNSAGAHGIAGVGWHLSGFPAIVRAPDTGMNFDASDTFVFLPGGWSTPENGDDRLVNVSGSYYRKRVRAGTPPEQFRPSTQSCGNGACYWEMRDGSGSKYFFGGDASKHPGTAALGAWNGALWEPDNGTTQNRGIVAWPLYKVVDPDGNYMRITYAALAETFRPARVDYNLPVVGGRSMAVELEYENRPDKTPAPGLHAVRLKNIRVYGHVTSTGSGTLIRRYQLTYTTSAASGRSLLIAWQEFGSDGDGASPVGLEAKTFAYTQEAGGGAVKLDVSAQPFACPRNTDPARCLWSSLVGDLNGDGKADLVRAYFGAQGGHVVYRCGGDTASAEKVQTDVADAMPAYLTTMGDFNGDGRQDVVRVHVDASANKLYPEIAHGGASGTGCALGAWTAQPSYTVSGATLSRSAQDWRALAADLDADGHSDLVLFDNQNRVLYWRMYRNGQLSATAAGRHRSGVEWTGCNSGYPATFGNRLLFNGILAADHDGDGKADVVASWSRAPAFDSGAARSYPGQISVLGAKGTTAGLAAPSEECHIPNNLPNGAPSVRFPYTAMRLGDINGDGRTDVSFSYQGAAGFPSYGTSHGRDVRFRLGTTASGGGSVRSYSIDTIDYPDAACNPLGSSPCHFNQWQYEIADVSGDGIADYVQSYRGLQGDKLYYTRGSPTGIHSGVPGTRLLDDTAAQSDSEYPDHSNHALVSGDFNGDGIADVARISTHYQLIEFCALTEERTCFGEDGPRACCTCPSGDRSDSVSVDGDGNRYGVCWGREKSHSAIHFGSPSGLGTARTGLWASGLSAPLGPGQIAVADWNGDGRDDIISLNDDATLNNLTPYGHSRAWVFLSPGGSQPLPDLLTTIDNGMLGKTTVTYRAARQFSRAIRTDLPSSCWGWLNSSDTGLISNPICGRVNGRPRQLVYEVSHDHGVSRNGSTFKRRLRYDYDNGRYLGGSPLERADLGYMTVTVTDLDSSASVVQRYRQDEPFHGHVDAIESYAADGAPLTRSHRIYSRWAPISGLTAIAVADVYVCSYEEGQPLPCLHTTVGYDPTYLVRLVTSSGTQDIGGEKYVFTQASYSIDPSNWLFRVLSSWSTRQRPDGTWLVLDMRRFTYDTVAGKTTHVLKRERILFDDAEAADCAHISDPWNAGVCGDRISSGAARWVTTLTTHSSSYDTRGNLTWFGSYPVPRDAPNPPWVHPVTLTYDRTYRGLLASTTNALNQTTSFTYDAAGRLLTMTDPNNQTTTSGYDIYGRPTTYAPPGVGLYQKRWAYAGADPVRGYEVRQFTYSSPHSSHQMSIFFDGFGRLAQTRDYTGTAAVPIDTLNQDVWIAGERVRRESWPYGASDQIKKLSETTFDARGRPLRIKRVKNDASFSTDNTASGWPAVDTFAYSRSGDKRVTTRINANGNTRNVYTSYRGLVTQVTDAAGNNTLYGYSTAFRVAQVTLPATTNNIVTYSYDSWGRLKTERDPNGEGFVAYTYDDASMLTKKTYFRQLPRSVGQPPAMTVTRELNYAYDQLDRVVGERGGLSSTNEVTYLYDETTQTNGVGRLTTVTDPSGATKFDYDGRGNVTSRAITLSGLSDRVTYRYAYNDRGLVTGIAFPDAVQKFTYTVDGVLTSVLHNGVSWGSWTNFDVFRRAGTFQAYNNGGWTNTTDYAFDVDQRVSRIRQRQKNGRIVQDLSYDYDAIGNVRAVTDHRTTKTVNGINTDLTQRFAYDALNRLCAIWEGYLLTGVTVGCATSFPAPTATFTYDGIGNLLTDSGSANIYFARLSGERVIENRTGAVVSWRAYQDSEGKRTRFEDCSLSPCVNHSYGYDYRGRLTSVTRDGVMRESYEYDFSNRRTKKSYNNLSNTSHAWFFGPSYTVRKNSVAMARTAKTLSIAGIAIHTYGDKLPGTASAETVDSNTNRPFASDTDQSLPQGVYVRQPDLLGSQTAMTRISDGAVVSRNRYDAWGNHLAANSLGQDTAYEKFTGQPQENFSGLAFYGFRYYHPKTRRFVTPDDRITGGAPQAYNRFAYVLNNPATYIDPTGHQTTGTSTCVGCGAGGGGRGGSGASSSDDGSRRRPWDYSPSYQFFKWLFGVRGDDDDAAGAAPPGGLPPKRPPEPPDWGRWKEVGHDPKTGVRVYEPKTLVEGRGPEVRDPAEPDPGEEVTEIGPVRTGGATTPSLGEVIIPEGEFDPPGEGEKRVYVEGLSCVSDYYCPSDPLGVEDWAITTFPGVSPTGVRVPGLGRLPTGPRLVPGPTAPVPVRIPPVRIPLPTPVL